MRLSKLTAASIPLALPFTTALAGKVVRSELISHDTLKQATGGDDLRHTFKEDPERVRVRVAVKLKQGTFTWRVEDSDGDVLWRKTVKAKAAVELDKELPGSTGEWRVVVDYESATGRYHIEMEAVPVGAEKLGRRQSPPN